MKPDWKDAPEWAQWLAMDANGFWWWYEEEPVVSEKAWMPSDSGDCTRAFTKPTNEDWLETLTPRPEAS